jgi:hypothetical protein
MRYLGILTAIVVAACVFAFVTRYSANRSSSGDTKNTQDYGATVNAVRETVKNSSGSEMRKKWAITQEMKESGASEARNYSTDGQNAEVLVIRSGSMDITACSNFMSENGNAAASIGFTSLSCRTTANGVVLERELKSEN